MIFHSLCSLSVRAVLFLNALSIVATAASDARLVGYSIQAVKIAQRETPNQPDLLRRGNDEIPVGIGSQWALPVQIGNPAQSFLMTPDSGAPSLAVKSVFLPKNESGDSPTYDPSKSSTASKLEGYTYSNCFASGHCGTGLVYNDTVNVGNVSVQMAFEVSTSNNGVGNGNEANSGNFGLNFAQGGMTTSPKKVPTWLQTVLPLCKDEVFTMDFNETSSSGTIDFGFIDNSKYDGEIGYTPVLGTGDQWGITFSGFQVGSNGTFNDSQSWNAIVDSGTVVSGLPKFVVDGYFQNIPGAVYDSGSGKYRFQCSTALPDFVFGIAGDARYRGTILLDGKPTGNGMCLTKLSVGTGTMIFGQNFIESQFVIFDFGNGRVGFANKGSSQLVSSNPSQTSSAGTSTPTGGAGRSSVAAKTNSICKWGLYFFILSTIIVCHATGLT